MSGYSALWKYTQGVASGAFDQDLSREDRAAVLRLLHMAVNILADYGATDAVTLWRMVRDPMGSTLAVNERTREIIAGCLS